MHPPDAAYHPNATSSRACTYLGEPRSRCCARGPEGKAPQSTSDGAAVPAMSTPAQPEVPTHMGMVTYPLPIRPGVKGTLILPEDLSRKEAERVARFVAALAFDEKRALTGPVSTANWSRSNCQSRRRARVIRDDSTTSELAGSFASWHVAFALDSQRQQAVFRHPRVSRRVGPGSRVRMHRAVAMAPVRWPAESGGCCLPGMCPMWGPSCRAPGEGSGTWVAQACDHSN